METRLDGLVDAPLTCSQTISIGFTVNALIHHGRVMLAIIEGGKVVRPAVAVIRALSLLLLWLLEL